MEANFNLGRFALFLVIEEMVILMSLNGCNSCNVAIPRNF